MSDLPSYDELPTLPGLDLRHAWDVFGREDELGTLNLLDAARVKAGLAAVRAGEVVALSLPADQPDPPLFGRRAQDHVVFEVDRNTWDDRLDGWYPQSSTQWDSFRHVRAREHGFWGGRTGRPDEDRSWLGVDVWARRGIVGRGVLLDVGGHLAAAGDPVAADEERALPADLLEETARAQGVEVEPGDVLLVRTGWPAAYAGLSRERRVELGSHPAFPGLHAGEPTARLLWNWHVAALATDCPAVEPVPGDPGVGSLHRRLLPLLGLPLGELFDLETLADRCRRTGAWTFLFTSAPLHVPGGVGSPGNALAIL